jgi:hypothetical protein
MLIFLLHRGSSRNRDPQRALSPNSRACGWTCHLISKGRFYISLMLLTLKWGDFLNCLHMPNLIMTPLEQRAFPGYSQREMWQWKKCQRSVTWRPCRRRTGIIYQGMQMVSRRWKTQRSRFSQEHPEGSAASQNFDFSTARSELDF